MFTTRELISSLAVTAFLTAAISSGAASTKPVTHTISLQITNSASFYLSVTSQVPVHARMFSEKTDPKTPLRFSIALQPENIPPIQRPMKIKAEEMPPELLQGAVLTNHVVMMRELGIEYYVCPRAKRYNDALKIERFEQWKDMPDALGYKMFFDFRGAPDGTKLYLDGKYAAFFPNDGALMNRIEFSSTCLPVIEDFKTYEDKRPYNQWEIADLSYIGNPGVMSNDTVSLSGGEQIIDGTPIHVLTPAQSMDIGRAMTTHGIWMLEVDYNLSRTAFERLPEAFITSVPNKYYDQAAVLFALDPDPAKDRAMTLRVTRFCKEGRGDGLIHDDIAFPEDGKPMPRNIKQVGTVMHRNADDSEVEIPLYIGYFPLNSGEILDIINNDPCPTDRQKKSPYLDVEIFARRNSNVGAYVDGRLKPVNGVVSAVNVFGISLHRAPAEFRLVASVPGNIFETETPETTAQITGVREGKYLLGWTISNSDGELIRRQSIMADVKAGETKDIKIPLEVEDIGHYHIDFTLSADGEYPFLSHNAMFAVTGPDTRKMTRAESPFGSWWVQGPHHCSDDPEFCLGVLHKAGIRKTLLKLAFRSDKPASNVVEAAEKHQVTLAQFQRFDGVPWAEDPEKAEQQMLEHYEPLVKAFPDCKQALVLHESYGDSMPPELLGEEPPSPTPERDIKITKRAEFVAKFFRKHYPDIKLVFGNNTSSSGVMATLFRNGLDPKLVDYIGIETPGQGCIPERLWRGGTQGTWFADETAKHFGYDIPITGCYEFTARPLRLLGMTKQAEYKIRDALVGLSYGFDYVGMGAVSDVANGYLQTIWGTCGLLTRNSLHYPKPLFSAVAAVTRTLDQMEVGPKTLDTGANTTYALEFKRKDGKVAYACWMPVGEAILAFEFPNGTEIEQIEFLGKTTRKTAGKFDLNVGTGPCYLVTSASATSVKHVRTIPNEPPKPFKVVEKLDSLDGFRIMGGVRNLDGGDMYRKQGKFEFTQVNDAEHGSCVAIKLVKEGKIKAFETEYTKIQFKRPDAIEGTPDEIGMWVNGDGGWGKIGFEIQDAEGRLHRSEGQWHDFGAETFIAFTGWRFIKFPIDGEGVKKHLNQSLGARWSGKTITYPIKITGLFITLTRQSLNPAEMKEVPGVIRIKDLGTIANPEYQQ